ncbi:ligase-associated DNA damage response endonuclease PdeM [Parvularcula sp. LCG005]|uniref:ligase-associated DNA damage response endonuclease PdeM n=1 Tax=Parvularcula sp. LCG005 TaxID=3078805 RepID=UPI002941DAA7|nr:ligase-associated DNA damage response endonuclease PdeM [Parvularcula sp. LCG005]WOI52875.1 ligase-associated DNA damage response endonuclease PdeM [Parvularcula sp. LCG005]
MSASARQSVPLAPTHLAGQPVVMDAAGALWLPQHEMLIVSDLHFEKGSHYAKRGLFLPPYDTRATLTALEQLCRIYRPRTILSLGDAFHDPEAEERMDDADAARLDALCRSVDWIWVLGNHDPYPPKRFCGAVHSTVEIHGLTFAHEPWEVPEWNLAGHLHPCAIAVRDGHGVRRACFVSDDTRMILPSFGAYTGGLNVMDTAFRAVFSRAFQVHLLGKDRVYRVPHEALRPDGRGRYVGRLPRKG